jgi:UDP-N-acetyl-D-galactosamine dehydrogenase
VIDIIKELKTYQINLSIVDPWADPDEVFHEYQINTSKKVSDQKFDAVILAVGHNEFKNLTISDYLNEVNVVYDVKGLFDKKIVDGRL